jgi:hypothetical protein
MPASPPERPGVIRSGPQVRTLDEASTRKWLVADGVGGYAMGTVAGCGRAVHGLLAARSRPRHGCSGSSPRPVLVVGDGAQRLATDEWAGGTVDPRGHELLVPFDSRTGSAWRWQVGGRRARGGAREGHGRAIVGVVHRLVRADRPVRLELTPLCTWRSVHGERFAFGTPAVEATAEGFVFESASASRRRGWMPAATGTAACRAREEAARGLNDREGRLGGRAFAVRPRPGRRPRGDGGGRRPFDGRCRARPRSSPQRGARARGSVPGRGRRRRGAARARGATSSRSRPAAGRPRWRATRGSASGRAT